MQRESTLFFVFFSLIYVLQAQPVEKNESPKNPDIHTQPDIFGYQDYNTHLLKFSLLETIQMVNSNGIVGRIEVAYEHKFKEAWSLNTEISANYFFSKNEQGQSSLQLSDGILSLNLEPRYYLDLKRRISARQSKNNFSANYLGLACSTRLIELRRGFSATDNARYLYSDNFSVSPLFGIQRRIIKWLYVDFSIGGKVSYGDPVRTRLFFPKDSPKVWQVLPVANLKLGLAI